MSSPRIQAMTMAAVKTRRLTVRIAALPLRKRSVITPTAAKTSTQGMKSAATAGGEDFDPGDEKRGDGGVGITDELVVPDRLGEGDGIFDLADAAPKKEGAEGERDNEEKRFHAVPSPAFSAR